MDYLAALIDLYATHGVATIRKQPALLETEFGKPLQALADDWDFPPTQALVEGLQERVEQSRPSLATPDNKAQIRACLDLLLDLAMFDESVKTTRDLKLFTLKALLEKRFAKNWSDSQQDHFDYVFVKMRDWSTYFLSYTNAGAKAINDAYKPVIERLVPQSVLNIRDLATDNLLVDAVVESLKKRLLNGFYDKQEIKVGDPLKEKISPACGSTFAFVQLIQFESFRLPAQNWCFIEYSLFLVSNQAELGVRSEYQRVFSKRFNAVLAGSERKDVVPPLTPLSFEPWINTIFVDKRFLSLPRDPDDFDTRMNELAGEIVNLKFQIMDNIP